VLDAKTILFSLVAAEITASAVLCFLFFFGRHRDKAANLSIGLWSAAFLLGAAGTLLLSFRSTLADGLTIILANFLILFGTGLRQSGVAAFFHQPLRIWVAVLVGGGWLFLCLISEVRGTLSLRIAYTQPVMIILIVWSAVICLRHDRENLITPRIYAFSASLEAAAHVSLLICLGLADVSGGFAELRSILVPAALLFILVSMVLCCFTSLSMPIERSLQQFRYDAYRDSLTGLPNRRAVFEQAALLRQQMNADDDLTVIRFDIDDFKQVNDTFGHAVGDTVLQVFGAVCRDLLPASMMAGRLGGDEFAIVCNSMGPKDAEALVDRIKQSFAIGCFEATHGAVQVSLSAGISIEPSGHGVDDALEVADKAAYQAKRKGPDNTVIITPFSSRVFPTAGKVVMSRGNPRFA